MKTNALIVLISLLFLSQSFSQIKMGEDVVIDEKVYGDLYVAGGSVTINAPVQGDLVVAGGTVIINDSVSQDVLAAGGNLTLNGHVGDDVRCTGGNIKLLKSIDGDMVVAGGALRIGRDASIKGNLISSAGEVVLDGTVHGDTKSSSGQFTLNGKVNDLNYQGGKILINGTVDGASVLAANTIELGTGTIFNKDVRYWSEEGNLDFDSFMKNGDAVFDVSLAADNGGWKYSGVVIFVLVLWYLIFALAVIFLFQYFFKNTLKKAADTFKKDSLTSLGLGFLFLAGVPLTILFLLISVIGIPVAVLMFIVYLAVILVATVIVSTVAANWINNTYYQSSWSNRRIILTAFSIFIVLKLVFITPFVGPLITFLLVCMALGAILLNLRWKRRKNPVMT